MRRDRTAVGGRRVRSAVASKHCARRLLRCAFCCAAWFFPTLGAAAADDRVRIAIEVGRASASGFLQTPAGGNPGTSSLRRPTLDETDSDRPDSARVAAALGLGRRYRLRLAAERLWLHGDGASASDFFTQGELYPTGTALRQRTRVDLIDLDVARAFAVGDWTLAPSLGLSHFRFDYDLEGDNGAFAIRDYSRTGLNLGFSGQRALTPKLSLALAAQHTVKLSQNTHERRAIHAKADYALSDRIAIYLRVGAERIDYEDEQVLPNHLRIKRSPYYGLGVQFTP
ncbi:MAG: hypothetical protein AAF515_05460 [Pseudomonadota bacterium]